MIFPFVVEGKLFYGRTHRNGSIWFKIPKSYSGVSKSEKVDKNGDLIVSLGVSKWLTNIKSEFYYSSPVKFRTQYSEGNYKKFDTYDAINIDYSKDIPMDYYGVMAVPISFLVKINPVQFEIIGELNHGSDNKYDYARPIVNGVLKYTRLLIKRKN